MVVSAIRANIDHSFLVTDWCAGADIRAARRGLRV